MDTVDTNGALRGSTDGIVASNFGSGALTISSAVLSVSLSGLRMYDGSDNVAFDIEELSAPMGESSAASCHEEESD